MRKVFRKVCLSFAISLAVVPGTMAQTPGSIVTPAGNGYSALGVSGGYAGDRGPATAAELDRPTAVAVDSQAMSILPTLRISALAK
jgi:hypothetical protein